MIANQSAREGSVESRAVYIVKPEAFEHREIIRRRFAETQLKLVEYRTLVLPPWFIKALYSGVTPEIFRATLHWMGREDCEIGVVQGRTAALTLLRIGGKSVDPRVCATGTIRSRYGIAEPVHYGSSLYFRNGFHRPRNAREAAHDLELLAVLVGHSTSLEGH